MGTPADPAAACAETILEAVLRTMRLIRRELRAQGGSRLTVPQLHATLFIKHHPGTSLSAVAEHLGISRPACSALVDRLVRGGLLDRCDDPGERRRAQLRLSPRGEVIVARAHRQAKAWLQRELSQLPGQDLRALQEALPALERLGPTTAIATVTAFRRRQR